MSTRTLTSSSGDPYAVAYLRIFGDRTIALFPLPPRGDAWPLVELAAPAPSTVTGADADADGTLDVVITHRDGAALYLGASSRALSIRDLVPAWTE